MMVAHTRDTEMHIKFKVPLLRTGLIGGSLFSSTGMKL